jgi:hypothetical protein
MSIMVGTGTGARNGILIKTAETLERLEKVDILVIDKTGTLTEGKPQVVTVKPNEGVSAERVIELAASLERGSEHPLAGAVRNAARQRRLFALPPALGFESITGRGVKARIAGEIYGLGNALTFPLSVGATTVLMAERPTPDAVFHRLQGGVGGQKPTAFYGAPTLFAAMLASPALPVAQAMALRLVSSAGEALPADIGQRYKAHFGVDIVTFASRQSAPLLPFPLPHRSMWMNLCHVALSAPASRG